MDPFLSSTHRPFLSSWNHYSHALRELLRFPLFITYFKARFHLLDSIFRLCVMERECIHWHIHCYFYRFGPSRRHFAFNVCIALLFPCIMICAQREMIFSLWPFTYNALLADVLVISLHNKQPVYNIIKLFVSNPSFPLREYMFPESHPCS